jgi:hypothetical protein
MLALTQDGQLAACFGCTQEDGSGGRRSGREEKPASGDMHGQTLLINLTTGVILRDFSPEGSCAQCQDRGKI